MVSKKKTRKLMYQGILFYWFVRRNQFAGMKIHILSEDKKIYLERVPIDSEAIITPKEIRILLEEYFKTDQRSF